jgi:hypothetical protein
MGFIIQLFKAINRLLIGILKNTILYLAISILNDLKHISIRLHSIMLKPPYKKVVEFLYI